MPSVGELRIEHQQEGSRHRIAPAGELDLLTAPALASAFERALDAGGAELTVDLRAVVFMDSSGLRTLLAGWDSCRARGCELRLIPDMGACRRLFEITGVIDELPLAAEPPPGTASEARSRRR